MDNKNKAAAQSKNVMDLYMAMNKKGFNDLKMKQKISSRLSQTISGLGTPIWDISDKYSFILREEQYKQFLKEEDAAYTSYIKNSETRMARKTAVKIRSGTQDLNDDRLRPVP